ncbi:MAG: hypothetical protein U9Q69_03080 [Nanoarchaeota archaeon]|nr:hypothetical protein [Nanoarchaeota archaeon]
MILEISNPVILCALVFAFFSTLFILPYWIKRIKNAGLVGVDVHKWDKRKIAEMGGIPVIFGFLFAILFYIAVDTFYLKHVNIQEFLFRDLQILAALVTIMIIVVIGIVDDILGWKIGLRQWQKPILVALASVPMMVVNAGNSMISLPFMGKVNLGILYPLFFIPLGISGTANGFNMLAGYNGLESGMGIIILSALGYVAWITDHGWVSVLAFGMVMALLAFYVFNRYPAKVFPGDTLTYTVGGLIAIIAILANMERFALILFIPYFIEAFLKLRGMFRKQSFALVSKDGSLGLKYSKFYSLNHVVLAFLKRIKRKVYEKEVVYSIFVMELFIVCIGLIARG